MEACPISIGAGRWQALSDPSIGLAAKWIAGSTLLPGIGTAGTPMMGVRNPTPEVLPVRIRLLMRQTSSSILPDLASGRHKRSRFQIETSAIEPLKPDESVRPMLIGPKPC
jgi:hypothetical protein